VYSLSIVGWMVTHRDSATLGKKLIADTCARQGLGPGQLTFQ